MEINIPSKYFPWKEIDGKKTNEGFIVGLILWPVIPGWFVFHEVQANIAIFFVLDGFRKVFEHSKENFGENVK